MIDANEKETDRWMVDNICSLKNIFTSLY